MRKLLVILGPTATGKTGLGLRIAKKFNGELISCDSRQVYRGLDVGTGKLSGSGMWEVRRGSNKWEMGGVKIWMYDVVDPKKQYTVADYVKDAEKVIGDIQSRGKLPIIVGGTGLYLKALTTGLPNLTIPVDLQLRKKLEQCSLVNLQEKLKKLSFKKWQSLNESDRQNPRRLVRSIELSLSSMRLPRHFVPRNDVLQIGLTASREVLYKRVDDHVVSRIKQGMLEEAESLHKKRLSLKRMRQLGLEYGVLADYLEGKIKDRKVLVTTLQNKIHGFVRRQLTWFKKERDVQWFDITKPHFDSKVEKEIAKWYYST